LINRGSSTSSNSTSTTGPMTCNTFPSFGIPLSLVEPVRSSYPLNRSRRLNKKSNKIAQPVTVWPLICEISTISLLF
jgi:hypothetical protein